MHTHIKGSQWSAKWRGGRCHWKSYFFFFFKYNSLRVFENFISCTTILLTFQSLHILPSSLQHIPQNQLITKQNTQTNTSLLHLSNTSSSILVALGAVVCHTVYLFVQSAPPTNRSRSHWSSGRSLAHHHHWALSKSSLGHLAAAPSHGDPAVIVPQDQTLHTAPKRGRCSGWANLRPRM